MARRRKRPTFYTAGELVSEGILLAVPLCLPGQSVPPPAGETAMTALAYDPIGTVYCGTRGTRAHVLGAVAHRDSGIIHDLGVVPDADAVVAFALPDGKEHFLILASGPSGGALWSCSRWTASFCIQEWFAGRYPMRKVCDVLPGQTIEAAVASPDGQTLFGLAGPQRDLFRLDAQTGETQILYHAEEEERDHYHLLPGLGIDFRGRVWGTYYPAALWTYDPNRGELERPRLGVPAAAGRGHHTYVSAWAADPVTGVLYGGTAPDGFLFKMDPDERTIVGLGKPTRMDEITCLTIANDGRVYGMAGTEEDIGHLFCYEPESGSLRDLGTPVSVLTARQYGYHFRCAVTGPGGELYFGQHERVNHLWMYFPPIPQRRAGTHAGGTTE